MLISCHKNYKTIKKIELLIPLLKHRLDIEITIENIEIKGSIILQHITGFTSHETFDLNNLLQPLKAV